MMMMWRNRWIPLIVWLLVVVFSSQCGRSYKLPLMAVPKIGKKKTGVGGQQKTGKSGGGGNTWLNETVSEFPTARWVNQVEQRHPHCIALLVGFDDVMKTEGSMVAAATAIELHRKHDTSADIVVMLYGANGVQLPAWQADFLTELGVRLRYVDMKPLFEAALTASDKARFRAVIMYAKWFVWTLEDYERVLFHDLDVQPLNNFNHYFAYPLEGRAAFFVEGNQAPVNGGFFMIKPDKSVFEEMMRLSIVSLRAGDVGPVGLLPKNVWDPKAGWTTEMTNADWKFPAGNYDQGLLWYFCKQLVTRCIRVRNGCNGNSECTRVNNQLQKQFADIQPAKAELGTYCGARTMQIVGNGSSVVLSEDEALFLNAIYVFDFSHYAGPPNKPWNICSSAKMTMNQMKQACMGAKHRIQEYCQVWRAGVIEFCTRKQTAHAALADPEDRQCIVGSPPGGSEGWNWKQEADRQRRVRAEEEAGASLHE